MTRQYYTDLELADAVASYFLFLEVARKLGLKDGGGSQAYLQRLIQKLELDISHFSRKTPSKPPLIYTDKNLLNRSSKNITFLCPNYIVLGKHVQA